MAAAPLTALIVLPEGPDRSAQVATLLALGYQPVEASDHDKALLSLSKLSHSFVVADAEYDALALVEKIKTVDLNLPILVMTGADSAEIFFDLLKYPRMLGVCKPFDEFVFRNAIDRVINLPVSPTTFRRNSLRLSVDLPADLGPKGTGRIKSLSLGGLFVEAKNETAVGDILTIRFPVSGSPLILATEGKVVRAENGRGLGVEITSISEDHRLALRAFLVRELLRKPSAWLVSKEEA